MSVAQKLYEAGKITYMRTDSTNLSNEAMSAAEKQITLAYGAEFSKPRAYTKKSKGAQEAHEAIRPTYMQNPTVDGERNHQRLYDLIWKRTWPLKWQMHKLNGQQPRSKFQIEMKK